MENKLSMVGSACLRDGDLCLVVGQVLGYKETWLEFKASVACGWHVLNGDWLLGWHGGGFK